VCTPIISMLCRSPATGYPQCMGTPMKEDGFE
jgi:hypothetical protein